MRLSRIEKWKVLCVLLALVANPVVALATTWEIDLPNEDDEIWTDMTIEARGTGYTESEFEVRIMHGTTIVDQHGGTTSSECEWNHDFEPPTSGWPVGDKLVELTQDFDDDPIPSSRYDSVNITIVDIE